MMSLVNTDDPTPSRLAGVFQELLNSIPTGAATLETCRTKNNDGTIIWLKPANERSAIFSAHVEDDNSSLIDVSFGACTTFELPTESRLPDDADFEMMLDAMKAMGLAVIAETCRKYCGFLGVRGSIQVAGQKPLKITSFFHLRLFPKLVCGTNLTLSVPDAL
ncbi:MAG TPA: hypothetical protein VIW68_08945 [Candidatus Sulfotelmatobacter sp.]